MIAVTARTIPKTYASLAGSSFGAMVSPPGVRGAMPDLEGRNRERCVSYVTLRRLSKKCKVAKRPHGTGDDWGRTMLGTKRPQPLTARARQHRQSRVIPVSLLTEHDGLIHFDEHLLDHRLRQSVPLQCLIIECLERHQHFELGERCLPKVLVSPRQPPGGFGEVLHRLLVNRTWLHLIPEGTWTEKAPTIKGRGKLAERLEVEFGPFRSASSRRAEMILAYIYCSITHRVHFLDKARRAVTL